MSIEALEAVFTGLLVVVSVTIVWFAGYVVYKLFQGQR
ncbi:Methionine and alanine importer, small subunit [Isoptericola cucumis]